MGLFNVNRSGFGITGNSRSASTGGTSGLIPNTTAQFMQPIQELLARMMQQQTQGAAVNNRLGQNAQVQTARQNAALNKSINSATNQMYGNFQTGARTLYNQLQDPYLGNLMTLAMNQARNPGLSRGAVNTMKGQMLSSNAADAAATNRNMQWGMGGRGMSGASRNFLTALNSNRFANQANRGLANIDLEAEKYASGQGQASLSQAMGLWNQRAGLAGQYANFLSGYNPLGQMQAIMGLTQPLASSAFQYGSMMA